MSKRAAEAALKAYPKETDLSIFGYSLEYSTTIAGRKGFIKGYEQAEKELIPLINRLCEAVLFEWKDAEDLARKTLTQIKAQEEEK